MKKTSVITPEPQEGIEVKQKPPRVLIELLVFGHDKDKPRVHDLNKELQDQLSKHRKTKNRVRVFWRINNDETIEEMKQWLIDNSECKYYVFATDGKNYSVPNNYVVSIVDKIKKLEDSVNAVRNSGIVISKKKPEVSKIEEIQIIS